MAFDAAIGALPERGEYRRQVREADPLPAPNGSAALTSLNSLISHQRSEPCWPEPPAAEAFSGLAGELVALLAPHTETDPAAVLVQFLVAYGNAIGRSAHFVAEADRHFTNLFCVLVGETARGRKGSAWGHIHRLFETAAPEWADRRIQGGMSSGEGLVWAVRDPIERSTPVKKGGRFTGEYDTFVEDKGVTDKRLLAFEPELASTLRVMGREGNTLSALIRQAWDRGSLRVMTKNNPARATGAHISVVAHITADELRRELDRTEAANGFGNRFLWCCVRRSQLLPEGGNVQAIDFGPFLRGLEEAIDFGAGCGELRREPAARERWAQIYHELAGVLSLNSLNSHQPSAESSTDSGLISQDSLYSNYNISKLPIGTVKRKNSGVLAESLLSRGEAQVMRLALVYALLDLSSTIRLPHLEAAYALWRYCEDSVRCVFAETMGDPVADTILAGITAAPAGMTRTEISALLGRHANAMQIARALTMLQARGAAVPETAASGGRPVERWRAKEAN